MTDSCHFASAGKVRTWKMMALLLALLCLSCGSVSPPAWKQVCQTQSQNTAQTSPPQTANQLVIYLDTSKSMAGFVSSNRQAETIFSRILQELRNFATIHNPPIDIFVRRVDASVGEPLSELMLSQASVTPGMYDKLNNDLAGAISLFSRGLTLGERQDKKTTNGDSQNAPPAPPPPPARFHILVTDGVQSTDQQRADLLCNTGSDQVCVRKKILELLNNGWSGSIIGLRSEFKGRIYPELDRSRRVDYQSDPKDSNTFRPFYLYVFSPDQAALSQLVQALKARLRESLGQAIAGEDMLHELALTSPYAVGFAAAEARVPKNDDDLVKVKKDKEENPTRFTVEVDVETAKAGPAPFTFAITMPWSGSARDNGTPQELASLVSWDLMPVYPEASDKPRAAQRARYAEIKLTGQGVDAEGRVLLEATAQWPQGTGDLAWRAYKLTGHLNLEKQTPPWIQRWSTNKDDIAEMGNKTFLLESGMLGLWRNDVLKNQLLAEICLRVGPK